MAATMTFAACSNDEKITESTPKTVALTVKLPEFGGASSRAIDPETTTGNKVTINGPVKLSHVFHKVVQLPIQLVKTLQLVQCPLLQFLVRHSGLR